MEISIRRVRRNWLERLFLWERAYEARRHRGQEEIIVRGKTPGAAQAFLTERCFAENGLAITDTEIQIEVRGDLIIVTQPATQFVAIFTKPKHQPHLILKRRTDTDDHVLLAQVWQAANTKARELGWIV